MAYLPKSARGKTKFLGVGEKAILCYTQTKAYILFLEQERMINNFPFWERLCAYEKKMTSMFK